MNLGQRLQWFADGRHRNLGSGDNLSMAGFDVVSFLNRVKEVQGEKGWHRGSFPVGNEEVQFRLSGIDCQEWLMGQSTQLLPLPSGLVKPSSELAFFCSPQGQIQCVSKIEIQEGKALVTVPASREVWFRELLDRTVILEDVNLISVTGAEAANVPPEFGVIYGAVNFDLDIQSNKRLPADFGRSHAAYVSYEKGCYVGQEVLIRQRNFGKAKKTWVGIASSVPVSKPFSIAVFGDACLVEPYRSNLVFGDIYLGAGFLKANAELIERISNTDDPKSEVWEFDGGVCFMSPLFGAKAH